MKLNTLATLAALVGISLHVSAAEKKKGAEAEAPSAEAILSKIKAPAGWKVSLFAAPPDVGYPTCLAAAPDGDLFVGVDENGSLDAKGGRGRVVRCTDTDGDGRADRFVTFASMDSPRGIWFDDRTLYVMHPPLLQAFHDDNGDGVADRQEVLVRGLGFDLKFRGADHTVNGMRMGIDGFLYIAVGDYGATNAVGTDGRAIQLWGGGVVRVRPDGTGLEIVSIGQRNIYDVAVSPELDIFTRDNTNDGGGWDVRLSHVILGGNYGYPRLYKNSPDEIIQPLADYGGGSPCGSLFMNEPGFPEGFGRGLYTVEWGRNAILRHPLTANGAGWKAGQEKFVEMPRPTDMDVDGAGRVFLASWAGGGFNFSGPNVGYVAQVTPPGWAFKPVVDLKKASVSVLLQQIGSASAFNRLAAQREILRRAPAKELSTGVASLAEGAAPLSVRIAALHTLRQMTGVDATAVALRLAKQPALRDAALRVIGDDEKGLAKLTPAMFTPFLADTNARVRLQAATLLGRIGNAAAAAAVLPLTADADPLVAHIAIHALVQMRAGGATLRAFESPGSAAHQPGAARVLQALHEPEIVSGVIRVLESAKDAATRRLLLRTLARLFNREDDWNGKWWGTRPDTTGPYYKPVQWSESARIGGVLRDALAKADAETQRFLVVALQKNRVDLPELTPTVLRLAKEDATFRPIAVELLAGRSTLPEEAVGTFGEVAASATEPAALRVKAIRGLMKSATPAATEAIVTALTSQEKPPSDLNDVWMDFARDSRHSRDVVRFEKLASTGTPAVRTLGWGVLAHLASAKLTAKDARAAASAAVDAAWAKPAAAAPLLRAVTRLKLDAYSLQVRGLLASTDAAVATAAKEAAKVLKLDQKPAATGALIETMKFDAVVAAAKAKGDAKAGAEIYTKVGCVACHTTKSEETPKGPFLGGIATRYSRAELSESILKPSEKIAQGFETQWFKTRDGEETEGFVSREGGDDLDVRNIAGIITTLAKKDIAERGKRETSMMPAGLMDKLTPADLASLLAYLESLKAQ